MVDIAAELEQMRLPMWAWKNGPIFKEYHPFILAENERRLAANLQPSVVVENGLVENGRRITHLYYADGYNATLAFGEVSNWATVTLSRILDNKTG